MMHSNPDYLINKRIALEKAVQLAPQLDTTAEIVARATAFLAFLETPPPAVV